MAWKLNKDLQVIKSDTQTVTTAKKDTILEPLSAHRKFGYVVWRCGVTLIDGTTEIFEAAEYAIRDNATYILK